MTNVLTDESLRALQGQEADLFSLVYGCLAGPVRGYFTVNGIPDPDAATQDVFTSALPQIGAGSNAEDIRTMVFSVAHARTVEARLQSTTPVPHSTASHPDTYVMTADDDQAKHSPDEIQAMMQRLEHGQGDVLSLRIVAGLTVDQVAGVIGQSRGAVKQLQRRALHTLRKTAVRKHAS